jgi:hypothetical protein
MRGRIYVFLDESQQIRIDLLPGFYYFDGVANFLEVEVLLVFKGLEHLATLKIIILTQAITF